VSILCLLRILRKKEDFGSWNLRQDAKGKAFLL
jgi:hypothetical protein